MLENLTMPANCTESDELPFSEDYFRESSSSKLSFIYVDVALTAVVIAVFIEECVFVVRTYNHRDILIKSVWLISVYPVFSVSALLAVCIPRSAPICDFVSTVYLATCLFQFSSLLLLYFGNRDNLINKVKNTGFSLRSRPLCCICICCPTLPPVQRSLTVLRVMIFQTVLLQPVIQFISAVLWADGKFSKHGIDFTESFIYLTALKVVSTLIALYGLGALHMATRPHLITQNTAVKQTALQLVQIVFNIQGVILAIIAQFEIPPCHGIFSSYLQMQEWHHLVLVVEMFLLAVLARLYYRRPLKLELMLTMEAPEFKSPSNQSIIGQDKCIQDNSTVSNNPTLQYDDITASQSGEIQSVTSDLVDTSICSVTNSNDAILSSVTSELDIICTHI